MKKIYRSLTLVYRRIEFLFSWTGWMIALTRGDVKKIKPFPTVEQAYAHVRREDLRQAVMMAKEDTTPGAVMLSKGGQKPQQHSSLQMLSGEKQNITKAKSQREEVAHTVGI